MRAVRLGVALACLQAAPAALPAQEAMTFKMVQHGRLGVMIDPAPDPATDSIGARIRRVLPGSPAEAAGLQAGDIITRLGDSALVVPGAAGDDAAPGQRLIRLARRLEPGDTVQVAYRRGAESRTATVVTERGGHRRVVVNVPDVEFELPDAGAALRDLRPQLERVRRSITARLAPSYGLELVELNRDLGEYFGTDSGLLVVRAPADTAAGLRAGDVILRIDGRTPQSAGHAYRILQSYEPGERAKLEVMRKRKRTTITWVAPKLRHRHERPIEHGTSQPALPVLPPRPALPAQPVHLLFPGGVI